MIDRRSSINMKHTHKAENAFLLHVALGQNPSNALLNEESPTSFPPSSPFLCTFPVASSRLSTARMKSPYANRPAACANSSACQLSGPDAEACCPAPSASADSNASFAALCSSSWCQ